MVVVVVDDEERRPSVGRIRWSEWAGEVEAGDRPTADRTRSRRCPERPRNTNQDRDRSRIISQSQRFPASHSPRPSHRHSVRIPAHARHHARRLFTHFPASLQLASVENIPIPKTRHRPHRNTLPNLIIRPVPGARFRQRGACASASSSGPSFPPLRCPSGIPRCLQFDDYAPSLSVLRIGELRHALTSSTLFVLGLHFRLATLLLSYACSQSKSISGFLSSLFVYVCILPLRASSSHTLPGESYTSSSSDLLFPCSNAGLHGLDLSSALSSPSFSEINQNSSRCPARRHGPTCTFYPLLPLRVYLQLSRLPFHS